ACSVAERNSDTIFYFTFWLPCCRACPQTSGTTAQCEPDGSGIWWCLLSLSYEEFSGVRMKIKIAWAIQSLFLCFLFNLAFAAVIFFMADRILEALHEWVSPLTGPGAPALPDDLHMAVGSLVNFIVQLRG